MSKVRINDLARELEVKSRQVLDVLAELGLATGKTHSSSLEEDEAAKVRAHIERGTAAKSASHGAPPHAPPRALRPKSISRISPSPATCSRPSRQRRKKKKRRAWAVYPARRPSLRRRSRQFPLHRPIQYPRPKLRSSLRLQPQPRPVRLRAKSFLSRELPQQLSLRLQLHRPLPPGRPPVLWSPRLRQALPSRIVR